VLAKNEQEIQDTLYHLDRIIDGYEEGLLKYELNKLMQ
jgi:hypothetical protein